MNLYRLWVKHYTDSLSGLGSQEMFRERRAILEKKIKQGEQYLVCFIDLNGFKVVNDTLGHQKGNDVISAFGTGLLECFRTGRATPKSSTVDGEQSATREPDEVFISRVGGDEFTIIFNVTDLGENYEDFQGTVQDRIQEVITDIKGLPDYGVGDIKEFGASLGFCSTQEAPTIQGAVELADQRMLANKGDAAR